MTVQVTLNITDDLYRRAKQIARQRRRDVTELLADSITLPETIAQPKNSAYEEETAVTREEAAFFRLHPELWQNYPGQYVAIHNEALIDHDADQVALYLRVKARYPDQFVWIAPVKETAVEEYVARSPRAVEPV
jgi:hypothetical protein